VPPAALGAARAMIVRVASRGGESWTESDVRPSSAVLTSSAIEGCRIASTYVVFAAD
jgi:hypothetical protein